jgi:asparagine synthase (glutamine-hydrolysing)
VTGVQTCALPISDLIANLIFEEEMSAQAISEVIRLMDEPLSDPACLAFYLVCKAARSNNSKVLITGDGGDESTKGYDAFRFEVFSNTLWLIINIIPKTFRSAVIKFINKSPDNNYLSIKNKLSRFMIASLFPRNQRWAVAVSPNYFLAYLTGQYQKDRPSLTGPRDLECYFQNFVLPQIYLKKADRMSMGQGLEVRAPFLDSDLIDELMKVRVKPRRATLKPYAGEASAGKKKIKKHGLGVPLTYALLQLEYPEWVLEIPGLSPGYLWEVWNRRGSLSTGEAQSLWSLYVLNEKIKVWREHLAL